MVVDIVSRAILNINGPDHRLVKLYNPGDKRKANWRPRLSGFRVSFGKVARFSGRQRGKHQWAKLLSFLRWWTVSATRPTAKSTSSAVLNRPRPNRRLARVRSSLSPKARKHVAGLGVRRSAGAAGADGQVPHAHQQGLAIDVRRS